MQWGLNSHTHFQPITQRYKWKKISTINPSISENTKCLIVDARAPVINLKVVSLDHGVSFCFQTLRLLWATFQAKNKVKSAPASTALSQVSH